MYTKLPPDPPTAPTRALSVLSLLALAFLAQELRSQATLRGRVVDSELGRPISAATVQIRGYPTHFVTDSAGSFQAQAVPAGEREIVITALGYAKGEFKVQIPPAGIVEQLFPLDFTGYNLPEVVVRGRVEQLTPRYRDFERRRQLGIGAYLRWDELSQKGFNSVGDALRSLRGVRIRCNQETFECHAFMSRDPHCPPTWWVDGTRVSSFHENTSIRDVYGIEVYRGPGEVPGEFAGSDAACGVIVIWTKSRPYR